MLDAGTIGLLDAGLSLANKVLSLISRRSEGSSPAVVKVSGNQAAIEAFLVESVAKIERNIRDVASLIIEKLENDKLEELLSRTRNMSTLVELNRPDQAIHYAMTLRESIDYARNRVQENKLHWMGPYVGGYSVFLAALEYSGSCSEKQLSEFRSTVHTIKQQVLDTAAKRVIAGDQQMPWPAIRAFLNDEGEGVPTEIAVAFQSANRVPVGSIEPPFLYDSRPRTKKRARAEEVAEEDPNREARVRAAIRRLARFDDVHIGSSIPARKLRGAQKYLTPLAIKGDSLLALVDNTVLGGADTAIALYSRYFIRKEGGKKPVLVHYERLRGHTPIINGDHIMFGRHRIWVLTDDVRLPLVEFLQTVRDL